MTDTPPAAREAVARALCEQTGNQWEGTFSRDYYRRLADAALTAAAPHNANAIRAHASEVENAVAGFLEDPGHTVRFILLRDRIAGLLLDLHYDSDPELISSARDVADEIIFTLGITAVYHEPVAGPLGGSAGGWEYRIGWSPDVGVALHQTNRRTSEQ
jgi:hypothetical protein